VLIEIIELAFDERTRKCPNCGLSIDRDLNAARNILERDLRPTSRSGLGMNLRGGISEARSPRL